MLVAIIAAVLAFLRRKVNWGSGWVWPMPRIRVGNVIYQPSISDGVGSPRGGDVHRGVDIVYMRRSRTDRPEFPPGKGTGTPATFMPPGVPVLAAKDGVLWSSGRTATGGTVVIDHGKPFATYYTHMDSLLFPAHAKGKSVETGRVTHVKAGDVIGTVGYSPLDAEGVPHLHFSVAEGGPVELSAVDPQDAMRSWPTVPFIVTPRER